MKITQVDETRDVVRLRCEGTISQNEFPIGADPLEKALGPGCFTRKVLLDLEKTSFIDSSGVGWLIGSHKHFEDGGGRLVVHSAPPLVDQVLQLLSMPKVLHIAADETKARHLALGEAS
jgi:anti-anti-sigma factor